MSSRTLDDQCGAASTAASAPFSEPEKARENANGAAASSELHNTSHTDLHTQLYNALVAAARDAPAEAVRDEHIDEIAAALQSVFPYHVQMVRNTGEMPPNESDGTQRASNSRHSPPHADIPISKTAASREVSAAASQTEGRTRRQSYTLHLSHPSLSRRAEETATEASERPQPTSSPEPSTQKKPDEPATAVKVPTASSTGTKTYLTVKKAPPFLAKRDAAAAAAGAGTGGGASIPAPIGPIMEPPVPPSLCDAASSALTSKAVADLVLTLETFENFLRMCVQESLRQEPQHVLADDDDEEADDDEAIGIFHTQRIYGDDEEEEEGLGRGRSPMTDADGSFAGEVVIDTSHTRLSRLTPHTTTNSSRLHDSVVLSQRAESGVHGLPPVSPSTQHSSTRRPRAATAMAPSVVVAAIPPAGSRSNRTRGTTERQYLSPTTSQPAPYAALRLSEAPTMTRLSTDSPQTGGSPLLPIGGRARRQPSRTGRPASSRRPLHWSRVLAITGLFSEYLYQTLFAAPGTTTTTAASDAGDDEEDRATADLTSSPPASESLVERQKRADMTVSKPLAALHAALFQFVRERILQGIIASDKANARARAGRSSRAAGVLSTTMGSLSPSMTSHTVLSTSTGHRGHNAAAWNASSPTHQSPRQDVAASTSRPLTVPSFATARGHDAMHLSASASQEDPLAHDAQLAADRGEEEEDDAAAREEEIIQCTLMSWWLSLLGASGLAEATLLLLHQPVSTPDTEKSNSSKDGTASNKSAMSFDFLFGAADYLSRQFVLDHSGRGTGGRHTIDLSVFANCAGLPSDILGALQHSARSRADGELDVARGTEKLPASGAAKDVSPSSSSPVSYDPTVVSSQRHASLDSFAVGSPRLANESAHQEMNLTKGELAEQKRIEQILASNAAILADEPENGDAEAALVLNMRATQQGTSQGGSINQFTGTQPTRDGKQSQFSSQYAAAAAAAGMTASGGDGHGRSDHRRHSHPTRNGIALTGSTETVSAHTNQLINAFLQHVRDVRVCEPLILRPHHDESSQPPTNAPMAEAHADQAEEGQGQQQPRPNALSTMYTPLKRIQQDTATARHALQFATRLGSVYGTQDMNALLPLLPPMLQHADSEEAVQLLSVRRSQHASPYASETTHLSVGKGANASPRVLTATRPPGTGAAAKSGHSGLDARPQQLSPGGASRTNSLNATYSQPPGTSQLRAYWLQSITNHGKRAIRSLQRIKNGLRRHTESDASALQHDLLLAAMYAHQERTFTTLHSPSPFSMDAEESTELALSLTLTLLQGVLKTWKALNEGSDLGVTLRHAAVADTIQVGAGVGPNSSQTDVVVLESAGTAHTSVAALFGYSEASWPAVAELLANDVQFAALTALGRGQAPLSMTAVEVSAIFTSESHARRHNTAQSSTALPATMTHSSVPRPVSRRQSYPMMWLANFARVADTTRHLLSAGHRSPKPLEVSTWYLAGLAEYYVRLRLHVLHTHSGAIAGGVPPRAEASALPALQSALAPDAAHSSSLSLYDRERLLALMREAQTQAWLKTQGGPRHEDSQENSHTCHDLSATWQPTWTSFWLNHYRKGDNDTTTVSPAATSPSVLSQASLSFIQEELVAPAEQLFGVLTEFLETIASTYLSVVSEVRKLDGRNDEGCRLSGMDSSFSSSQDEDNSLEEDEGDSDGAIVPLTDRTSDQDTDPQFRGRDDLNSSLIGARGGDVEELQGGSRRHNGDSLSLLTRRVRRIRDHPSRHRDRPEAAMAGSLRDQQRWMDLCVHYFLEIFDVLLDASCALERRPLFLYSLTVGLYSAPPSSPPSSSSAASAPAGPGSTLMVPSSLTGTMRGASVERALHPASLLSPRIVLNTSPNMANKKSFSEFERSEKGHQPGEADGEEDRDAVEEDRDGMDAAAMGARSPLQQFLTLYSCATLQRGVNRLHSRKGSQLPNWLTLQLLDASLSPSTSAAVDVRMASPRLSNEAKGVAITTDGSPTSSAAWELSTMCWPDDGLKSWYRYLRVMQHNELIARFLVDPDIHALTVASSRAARETFRQLRATTLGDQRACAGSEIFISGVNALLDPSQGACAQLLSVSCTRPKIVRATAPAQALSARLSRSASDNRLCSPAPAGPPPANNAAAGSSAGPAMGLLANCGDLWLRLQVLRLLRSAANPLDLRQRRHFSYSLLLFSPSVPKRSMRRHFRVMAVELLRRSTILKTSQSPLYARLLLLRTVQALVSSRRRRDQTNAQAQQTSGVQEVLSSVGADDPLSQSLSGQAASQRVHRMSSVRSQHSSASSGGAAAGSAVVPYETVLALWNKYTFELLRSLRELCWYHGDAHAEAIKLGAPSVLAQFLASLIPRQPECVGDLDDESFFMYNNDTGRSQAGAAADDTHEKGNSHTMGGSSSGGADAQPDQPPSSSRQSASQPLFVVSSDAVPEGFVDFDDYGKDDDDEVSGVESDSHAFPDQARSSRKEETPSQTNPVPTLNFAAPGPGVSTDDATGAPTRMRSDETSTPSAASPSLPPLPPLASSPKTTTGFALPKLSFTGLGPALYYASSGDTGAAQEAALLFDITDAKPGLSAAGSAGGVPLATTGSTHDVTGALLSGHTGDAQTAAAPSSSSAASGLARGMDGRRAPAVASSPSRREGNSPLDASLTLTATPPGSLRATARMEGAALTGRDELAASTSTGPHLHGGDSVTGAPPTLPPVLSVKIPTLSFASLGPPLYFVSSGDTGMAQSQAVEETGFMALQTNTSASHLQQPQGSAAQSYTSGIASTGVPSAPDTAFSTPMAIPSLPVAAPQTNPLLPPMVPMASSTTTTTTTHNAQSTSPPPPPRGGGRPPLPVPGSSGRAAPILIVTPPPPPRTSGGDASLTETTQEVQEVPTVIIGPSSVMPMLSPPEAGPEAHGERIHDSGRRLSETETRLHQRSRGLSSPASATRGRPAQHQKAERARGGSRARRLSVSSEGGAGCVPAAPQQTVQKVIPTLRRQDSLRRQGSILTDFGASVSGEVGSGALAAAAATPPAPPSSAPAFLSVPGLSLKLPFPSITATGSTQHLTTDNTSATNGSEGLNVLPDSSLTNLSLAAGSPSFSARAAAEGPSDASLQWKQQKTTAEATLLYELSPSITAEMILNVCGLILQRHGGMISYGFTVSAFVQRKLPSSYTIQPRVLASHISYFSRFDNAKTPASSDRVSRRLAAAQLAPTPQGPSFYHVLRSLRQYLHTPSRAQRTVMQLLRQWLASQFDATLSKLWRQKRQSLPTRTATQGTPSAWSPATAKESPCGTDDAGCQPLAAGLCALVSLLMPDKTRLTSLVLGRRLGTGGYGSVIAAHYHPPQHQQTTKSNPPSSTTGPSTRGPDDARPFFETVEEVLEAAPKVALKMLPLSLQGSEGGMLPTVHAEVLNMLRLRGNPHIVELLTFGCTGDEYYVVMPNYEAGSVQRWRVTQYPPGCAPLMEKTMSGAHATSTRPAAATNTAASSVSAASTTTSRADPSENTLFLLCADVFTQVLEAVVFMHQRRIRHGDIKADNVFISELTGADSAGARGANGDGSAPCARPSLHIRVGDFGSSDTCDEDDLRALVRDVESGESRFLAGRWGSGRGTEAIQPPEMLFPKRRYQVLSAILDDVYARYEEEAMSLEEDDQAARADAGVGASPTTAPTSTNGAPATSSTVTSAFLGSKCRSSHHASISEAVFAAAREQMLRAELAVDIWACGCLLYELLTGRMLFGGARVGRAFVLATTAMKEHMLQHATVPATDTPLPAFPKPTPQSARDDGDTLVAVNTLDEWERRDLRLAVGEPVERFMASLLHLNPLERPTATEALYGWKELLAARRGVTIL